MPGDQKIRTDGGRVRAGPRVSKVESQPVHVTQEAGHGQCVLGTLGEAQPCHLFTVLVLQ